MTIGEAIRAYRKDNDLSQVALAEKWGVGQQAISYWESGRTFPNDDHCTEIAVDIGMKLADVLEMRHSGRTDPERDYSKGGSSKDEYIAELEAENQKLETEIRKLKRTRRRS